MSFLDGFSPAVRQAFCQTLSNAAALRDYSTQFLESIGVPQPFAFNGFRPMLQAFCSAPPPGEPGTTFPYGQCPVRYSISSTWDEVTADGTRFPRSLNRGCGQFEQQTFGPIGEPYRANVGGATLFQVNCFNADGQPLTIPVTDGYGSGSLVSPDNVQVNVQRCDGQLDNCGSPEPEQPEPGYNRRPINFNYDFGGNTINIGGDVEFNVPILAPGGVVLVPFTFVYLDAELNVPVTLNGTLNLNLGGVNITFGRDVGYRDVDPTKQPVNDDSNPDPVLEDDKDADDPVPEDMTKEEVIIGALVTANVVEFPPSTTVLFQGDNPDVIVPDLGLIQFQIRIGARTVGWTADIRVKNRRQVIPCPWEYGAIAVRGTPRDGVQWTITPIRALSAPTDLTLQ